MVSRQFFLLLLLIFITNAYGQDETPADNITGPREKAYYMAKTDPYFAETTDTFSVYGPEHITRNILQEMVKSGLLHGKESLVTMVKHSLIIH